MKFTEIPEISELLSSANLAICKLWAHLMANFELSGLTTSDLSYLQLTTRDTDHIASWGRLSLIRCIPSLHYDELDSETKWFWERWEHTVGANFFQSAGGQALLCGTSRISGYGLRGCDLSNLQPDTTPPLALLFDTDHSLSSYQLFREALL